MWGTIGWILVGLTVGKVVALFVESPSTTNAPNLLAARQALQAHGVPVVAEAVGGDFGRTVRLRVGDGRVEVSSVAHGTRQL